MCDDYPESNKRYWNCGTSRTYGIEQIAEVLGSAAGTVKSRLFHARQQLRDLIYPGDPMTNSEDKIIAALKKLESASDDELRR